MNSDKIIFASFAYIDSVQSGMNISTNKRNIVDVYMKNIAVALASAKRFAPDCVVALVTNLENNDIPPDIVRLFYNHEIQIKQVPFDRFFMGQQMKWGLAFYKLCALSHLVEEEYKAYCWIDSDVVVQENFDAIWKEVDENILLYDINHGLNTPNYRTFCNEVHSFLGCESYITHFGGEFFAAGKENALVFVNEAEKIYNEMKASSFVTTKGDEFITGIVANRLKLVVKNAGAYVHRFWTCDFRLTSTCYKYNKVIILHVPDEKEIGMIKLYEKYIKKGKFPRDTIVWRCLGLSHPHYIRSVKSLIVRTIKCMMNRRRV